LEHNHYGWNGDVGFVPNSFQPVVDGAALPHHPFDPTAPELSKNKPLMTGWNEDEYTFFAMFRDTKPLKSDFTFAARMANGMIRRMNAYNSS
jgi:para-nitrobenzyl esterase